MSWHMATLERDTSRGSATTHQTPWLQTRRVQDGKVQSVQATATVWSCVVLLGPENICFLIGFPEMYIFSISSYFSRTKIFIRHPRTLFATEDAFEICKHELGKALVTSDKRRRWFLQCHSFDLIGWCLQSLLLQPQESRPITKAIG